MRRSKSLNHPTARIAYRKLRRPLRPARNRSLPAMGMAGIAISFLEPDPSAEWDDQRMSEIHRTLDAWLTPEP